MDNLQVWIWIIHSLPNVNVTPEAIQVRAQRLEQLGAVVHLSPFACRVRADFLPYCLCCRRRRVTAAHGSPGCSRRVFCNPAALPVVARRRGFDALGKLSGVIQLPLPVMHRRNSYSGSGHGRLRSTSPRTSRRNSTTLPVVRRRNLGDRGAAPP